jgi:hypothetical protein
MPIDLERWFLDDGKEGRARVESLVTSLLVQARQWTGPLDADGLGRVRWLLLSPTRARIVGEFHDLASRDHMFWLELSAEGERVRWSLDYRPVGLTERARRNAIDLFDDREQLAWDLSLSGSAELREGGSWRR